MALRTELVMGTRVSIDVVPPGGEAEIERAFGWFHEVEQICSRFDERSELCRLSSQIGVAVPASAILFQSVKFALALAEETAGAFDPTVGYRMEEMGFHRNYQTGEQIRTSMAVEPGVSYRDVCLDENRRTITLLRPLVLDLGAVAKGLAVDLAAKELRPLKDFSIDAGGDLYLGGSNHNAEPWRVGIRHPRLDGELIETLRVSNRAVCTSGDYERGRHILDPRQGSPAGNIGNATAVASATAVAPDAMLADALATAAFVLGPLDGIALFEKMGVEGLIVTPGLIRYETRGLPRAA